MGDLNDIMSPEEKFGCNPPNLNRIASFCNYTRCLGLIDMGYNGPAYTWTNKRKGNEVIFERLDRCLANVEWCHHFPNTNVYHIPLIYGDHAPILVLLNPNFRKPKRSFKFENWWLLEEDFNTVAKNSWNDFLKQKSLHLEQKEETYSGSNRKH
ncbi:hypothetical protein DAI22_06g159100 [Oryza sativa Japonica Group]|nr:hypothetical protein DAI22_06g159100 [Oryza sativa Japonica Group]